MISLSKYSFLYRYRWYLFIFCGFDHILNSICILVGQFSIKSYKREYMITFLFCEFFMIVVFYMVEFLLFLFYF